MSDQLAFTKMQGVGNDFVVIDGRNGPFLDWSAIAIEMCDRNTGVGADGLLVIDATQFADLMMRMYNPDGTPDVCGNGLRCVARYAVERGLVAGDALRIATLAGVRSVQLQRGSQGELGTIMVGMGPPRFDPPSIPMLVAGEAVVDYFLEMEDAVLPITALNTGSTHAVTFVSELPDDALFFSLSPKVEHHPQFPERTSLMWCQVVDPWHLKLRIWERGAGETWGCGTGACAAAVAAIYGGVSSPGTNIQVNSKGGNLFLRWQEGESIQMSGPAEFVFEGVYMLDPSLPARASLR